MVWNLNGKEQIERISMYMKFFIGFNGLTPKFKNIEIINCTFSLNNFSYSSNLIYISDITSKIILHLKQSIYSSF